MLPSPLFPSADATQSERRVAQLLGHVDAGEPLIEHLRRAALSQEPTRRLLPVSALRELSATQLTSGGALVPTTNRPMFDLLRRYSVLAEMGCTIVNGLTGPTTIPRATTLPTASWLASEGQSVSESHPTFGQVALSPKYCSAYIEVSRQLMLQSDAESVVLRLVSESIGRAVDQAILAGTGVSGQPQGIVNTPGVYAQAGASLGSAGVRTMLKKAIEAGAREDRIRAIGGQDVWELLAAREVASGSGRFLWDARDGVLGRPAAMTSLAPPATLILGDWAQVIVALFDGAAALSFNPFADFRSGVAAFRIDVVVDVAITVPAAFSYSTNIT